uniref:non-specific serine/threonine protein kinase n=1 Tax=Araucaria cunninghamii TaxID=56994 RepID=A0A0D6QXW0_ARACU
MWMEFVCVDWERKMKLIITLLVFLYVSITNAACPINLDYVTKMSWNTTYCRSIQNSKDLGNCANTLLSVFGVGLAQYLRDESMFELPDNASVVACLDRFQQKLTSLGLPSDVVQRSFTDTSGFLSSPGLCAGIQTKQQWFDKVGKTVVDTACKGDLSGISACNSCHNSGEAVHRKLVNMIKNITEGTSRTCYYFACLYAAGVVNDFGPTNRGVASCILRLPFLQKTTSRRRIFFYSFMGATVCFLLLCSLGIGYFLWARMHGKARHFFFVRRNKSILQGSVKPNTGAVWFNMKELKDATDNFSETNVIGQGGFGTVYKGTLPDGQQIAVKKIRNCTPGGDPEFINEVQIINRIKHRNLVVLRGFSVASDDEEGSQRFLIYDYMANGSLDEHIFGEGNENRPALSWEQRKNIAIGTAKGLAYLHYGIQPAIYHRDIKTTNILLDDQMNACVADFGLAKITAEGQTQMTTTIAGTHGYLAPEYALYGQLTDRSDVYSFGVVLLEIMSGRKVLDNSVDVASDYLITDWAWKLVKADKTIQVVDRRIRDDGPNKIMERFVLVGIMCAHVMVAFRPTIVEALKMLEGDADIPEIPDRPLPLRDHGCLTDDCDSLFSDSHPSLSASISLR